MRTLNLKPHFHSKANSTSDFQYIFPYTVLILIHYFSLSRGGLL
jgi:hypothetical protein